MDTKRNDAVEAIVRGDGELMAALRGWWSDNAKGHSRYAEPFDDWLDSIIVYIEGQIGGEAASPADVAKALKIQAMGDKVAVAAAKVAERDGFEHDINCYVEEGVVYANVWIRGDDAEKVLQEAEGIAVGFRCNGYAVELWKEDLKDGECTVNAEKVFKEVAA